MAGDSGPDDPLLPEIIYAGGAIYTRVRDGWATNGGDQADPPTVDHPLWALDALLGARCDASHVGREHVSGVACSHYRLTIDLAVADEQLPAGITAPGPRVFRSLRRLPAEVWIDAAGLVRRLTHMEDSEWRTTELWEFGVDAGVAAPRHYELV